MATLSRAQVNRLVRLQQRGVEGADAQLLELAQTVPRELCAALGVPLARLENNTEPSAIADLAKESTSRDRQDREQHALEEAQVLAERIAEEAQHRQGEVHLDPFLMTRMVLDARPKGDLVVIKDEVCLGAISLSVLRAVMRECSGCHIDALYVDAGKLVLRYATTASRGAFRFVLGATNPRSAQVVLRLRAPRKRFLDYVATEVGR